MIRSQWDKVQHKNWSFYYKPLWELHHVLPILGEISQHLQDVLLTKLQGQFNEVHKSQFLQRLENLVLDCTALIFLQHFEKKEG